MEYSTLFHLGTIVSSWFVTFFGIVLIVRIAWSVHHVLSLQRLKKMTAHTVPTRLYALPATVKNYIVGSGFEQSDINYVQMKTLGTVSTKGNPDEWRTFRLRKVFRVDTASFVWYSVFHVSKWLRVHGVRECFDALGQYRLAFWGIFPARLSKSLETSSNAALAFLTSAVWYPHVFLHKRFQWRTLANGDIHCTMLRSSHEPVSVVMQFDAEHNLRSIRCKRYRGFTKVWWKIEFDDIRQTGSYRLPMKYREIWGSPVHDENDSEEDTFAQPFVYGQFTVTSVQLRGHL